MLADWLEALISLLFPERCPNCRRWTDGRGWCNDCLGKIVKVSQVAVAIHYLHWLDECLTVTDYAGSIQRMIRDIKFRKVAKHASRLSLLLDYAVPASRIKGTDIVVPVPLHAERLRERGFNQTTIIFKPWAAKQGLSWEEALERIRPTIPQWELSVKERRKNSRGAFKVTRPELIDGRIILLVDDIYTSGATMDECAKMLKKSGAAKVIGLALTSGAR